MNYKKQCLQPDVIRSTSAILGSISKGIIMDGQPEPETVSTSHGSRRKLFIAALIIVLLLLIGWLAWQLKACQDEHAQKEAANKQLQSKVDDLTHQLADVKKGRSTATDSPAKTACSATVSQSLKDNIAAAVNSKNYAALQGYMASSVNVVIAASEKGGDETAAQAVTDMAYLSGGTAPWDFNLSAATLNGFKAGFYKQYFEGSAYAGESANHLVASFGFDDCGKIDTVFMSASADILTS